jgi:hypothetical protein
MGIPDKHLNECITLALEANAVVTRQQRDTAWKHLHRLAARQVILAPYAIMPSPTPPPASPPDQWIAAARRFMTLLFIDEHAYHRAASNRHLMPIAHAVGTHSVIHFYPPMRYLAY